LPVEEAPTTPESCSSAEGLAPLTVDEASGQPVGNGATDPPSGAVERYALLGELGRGGIGLVLRGHDPRLGRDLALKVLLARHAQNPEMVDRFLEEAQINGQLQHPGIVPVHELDRFPDGRPYIAMKLVKGRTLADLLEERPDPYADRPRFLGIFAQVCQTVAYAHAKGVIHRDLKPGNVMVGAFGEVLVLDWGLAKVLSPVGPSAETTLRPAEPRTQIRTAPSGSIAQGARLGTLLGLGTYGYMPPEQALGEAGLIDARADVFGLGAILCVILTGQPPFVGSRSEVKRQTARGELADACARLDGCGADAALVRLAKGCLAPQPEGRPNDAGVVAQEVAAYLAGVQERLRATELERAAAEARAQEAKATATAERHARRLTLGLAAAVLVSGVTLGGLWWQQQRAERQAEAQRQRLAFEADLDRAATLRQQARWREARAVLDQTRERLGAAGPEDLRQRLEQAAADLDLVDRVEGIRLKRSTLVEGKFDNRTAEQDYAAAFRAAGLGQEGEEPEVVAARLRASAVAGQLVSALDDWAGGTREPKRRAWLLEVARRTDGQEWRDRFRDPKAWDDRAKLQELATELLEDEAKLSQLQPPLLAALGGLLRATGGDAVPLLKVAQARWPNDFWLNFNLALALYYQKKMEEAVGYYRVAVAVRPEAVAARVNLGNALHALKRLEEAIEAFRKALEIDPKLAAAHNNLGLALAALKRPEEAIEEYRKALEIDPKYAEAHVNLGAVLCDDLKRPEEAITEYRKALAIAPKFAPAYINRGNALRALQRPKEAIEEYRKALEIAPKDAEANVGMGIGNALLDLK
jgi:eukaryotic-like serine/threonine-protein kinase